MTPEQFIVTAMELRHEWIRKNPSREPNVLWCGDAAAVTYMQMMEDARRSGAMDDLFCDKLGMTFVHKVGTEGMIVCFDIEHKKP